MRSVIDELNKEIAVIFKGTFGLPIKQPLRRSKKRSYIQLILSNFNEVTLILERICEDQKNLAELNKIMLSSEAKKEIKKEQMPYLIKRESYLGYMVLDIKSLYIWTAKIYDLFEKYNAK
jgi:hypothetical protein